MAFELRFAVDLAYVKAIFDRFVVRGAIAIGTAKYFADGFRQRQMQFFNDYIIFD